MDKVQNSSILSVIHYPQNPSDSMRGRLAHMVQKCAILGCPAYLHYTRCDYYCLIVPYTRVHLEGASDTFKGVSITPCLKHNHSKYDGPVAGAYHWRNRATNESYKAILLHTKTDSWT
jgi:hypothetical protein